MGQVQRLPLFPLHTVLFPGMILPLHIFEERYKRMIKDCLTAGEDFGVVFIREGVEVGGRAVPHEIGTTARLTRIEHLDQGRMNIVTVGERRFRVLRLYDDRPYLTADVEFIPLQGREAAETRRWVAEVRPRVGRYIELLAQAVGIELGVEDVPSDPVSLAYMTAITLQIPERDKQELLASKDVASLLAAEAYILRREEALLRFMVRTQQAQDHLVTGATNYLYLN